MINQILAPIAFICIVHPISELDLKPEKFFVSMRFMILDSFAATSLANKISCVFVSIELSTVILAMADEWVRMAII
jgi:hypothetical protein